MTAQEIRKKYLDFFQGREHKLIPRASLVPQDDPTTLFTGSGMQPLIPYLLGQPHPQGKRLVDSQTCFRAEDMDEVGDNRHTTFFEMLGNWSLGDYYKKEQIPWAWELYTQVLGLDPQKIYVTCFIGDIKTGVPKDTETAAVWQKLYKAAGIDAKEVELGSEEQAAEKGMAGGRIFYYDASKNWWSREGGPGRMREGEPGGPDSEMFYDFGTEHNPEFGKHCHPNCDCGRFGEIGNSVFMAYRKVGERFEPLPKPNVDFGGGLERIAAAVNNDPDMFKISVIWPVIEGLERLSGKKYEEHQQSMRVITDHIRAATWLVVDGVMPNNKAQGYVLRRLLRRAIRYGLEMGLEQDLCEKVAKIVIGIYKLDFPEIKEREKDVTEAFTREEKLFRQTLRQGIKEFHREIKTGGYFVKAPIVFDTKTTTPKEREQKMGHVTRGKHIKGDLIFKMYDTYGFPPELTIEEAKKNDYGVDDLWENEFEELMTEQKIRSQTAAQGMFKGGLADSSEEVVKLHTATHLMYRALKSVLGDHVVQRGSNITAERTRFDFSHPEKVTPEQIAEVEKIVNEKITEDLPVSWKEESTEEALESASGAFGDKYGDKVKVYTIGDPANPFSREVCGGPHVEHTGQIGEGGKKFKIVKEESSSAGVRRIKAQLV